VTLKNAKIGCLALKGNRAGAEARTIGYGAGGAEALAWGKVKMEIYEISFLCGENGNA